jgi:hypothetical protein
MAITYPHIHIATLTASTKVGLCSTNVVVVVLYYVIQEVRPSVRMVAGSQQGPDPVALGLDW